jgi:hypothetical protein
MMNIKKMYSKLLAGLFAACLVTFGAQAQIVDSTTVMQAQQLSYDRNELVAMISSSQIHNHLVSLGVDPENAKSRIANMTQEELKAFNEQVAESQAGGIVGVVVTVLVVVLVTDLLGITDAYPFIRPIGE